ncbi:MAG TPA: protein-disulfide reductase DsbD domain-containing protein, partial [Chthoniobacterales bacterium]
MHRRVLLSVCLCLWFSGALLNPATAQVQDGRELVKATLVADCTSLKPGATFHLGVLYQMVPGWHIYWKYSGDAGIPTKIEWQLPAGFQAGDLRWPQPAREKEPGDLQVFSYPSEVLLWTEVKVPAQLPDGPVQLKAHSEWLVCERSCVPGKADLALNLPSGEAGPSAAAATFNRYAERTPAPLPADLKVGLIREGKQLRVHVEGGPENGPWDFYPVPPGDAELGHGVTTGRDIAFPVVGEGQPIQKLPGLLVLGTGQDQRAYEALAEGGGAEQAPASQAQTNPGGLLQVLAFAFLGGLILNVMPCVLPVISLKVFGFVSEAGQEPRKLMRLALTYVAGMLACFLALAAIVCTLRIAGTRVGWGFQFQDYRFVFGVALVVFAFALNLFGVFELSVSAQATGGLARLANGHGYGGAFFQGVFATVLATPCTAPFLGTASAFAFAQAPAFTVLVFFVIGLGMSSPYLLLAFNPRWLRFLPKPGAWMVRVKQLFGFLLAGTLLWLLWIIGQLRGVPGTVELGAALLVVAVLAWIKGSFWTPYASGQAKAWAIAGMAITLALAGLTYRLVTTPSQVTWHEFSAQNLNSAL